MEHIPTWGVGRDNKIDLMKESDSRIPLADCSYRRVIIYCTSGFKATPRDNKLMESLLSLWPSQNMCKRIVVNLIDIIGAMGPLHLPHNIMLRAVPTPFFTLSFSYSLSSFLLTHVAPPYP